VNTRFKTPNMKIIQFLLFAFSWLPFFSLAPSSINARELADQSGETTNF
jgi:hypothetical protein